MKVVATRKFPHTVAVFHCPQAYGARDLPILIVVALVSYRERRGGHRGGRPRTRAVDAVPLRLRPVFIHGGGIEFTRPEDKRN